MTVVAHTGMVTDNTLGTIQRCLDSRAWPPRLSIRSGHPITIVTMFFSDVGDLGLSVFLTAWDDWRVGVMRKIRLPLSGIIFQTMSLVYPGNVFEINLRFGWELYTFENGNGIIFETETESYSRDQHEV